MTEIALNTIRVEIQSLKLLEESIDKIFEEIVHLIHNSKGKIVLTGVGKSGIIAMKIAATLSSTGTPSFYLHAADATHGDLGIVEKKDVIVGISKSGNSQELKDLIPFSCRYLPFVDSLFFYVPFFNDRIAVFIFVYHNVGNGL